MKKLAKKNVRMVETVEELALVVAASCSCPCYIANTRYNNQYSRQRAM
ncbi:hypothetical protein [Desulfovibrio sp.]|nr:hypothetical protein [Desulfovibrio sp.]